MLESFCPIINSFRTINNVDKPRPEDFESTNFSIPVKHELGLKRKLDLPSNVKAVKEAVDYEETKFYTEEEPHKLFGGLVFFLDNLSKKDLQLVQEITKNGGILSTNLHSKVNFSIFSADVKNSTYDSKLTSIVKLRIPAVTKDFVKNCVKEQKLVETRPYFISSLLKAELFKTGVINIINEVEMEIPGTNKVSKRMGQLNAVTDNYDPDSLRDFVLLKFIQLKGKTVVLKNGSDKTLSNYQFYVLELHVSLIEDYDEPSKFCIFSHEGEIKEIESGKSEGKKLCRFLSTQSDAIELYSSLLKKITGAPKYLTYTQEFLSPKLGSPSFQNVQKEYHSNITTLEPRVVQIVDLMWKEAVFSLSNVLEVDPVNTPSWKINEAIKIILQIGFVIKDNKDKNVLTRLSKVFYNILKFKTNHKTELTALTNLNEKFNICNTLRDLIRIIESCPMDIKHDPDAMCRSLRCNINQLNGETAEFEEISNLVRDSQTEDTKISIVNIFSVSRSSDSVFFRSDIRNKKILFHGTSPDKLMGIISRGLDVSDSLRIQLGLTSSVDSDKLLGSGIYFTDSSSFSARYCKPTSRGTRIMVISEVALGNVYEVETAEYDLTSAPPGYNSVLGLKSEKGYAFSDNEYVIYDRRQCRLRYFVEFSFPEDKINDYPLINVSKKLQNKFTEEDPTEYIYNINNLNFKDESRITDMFGLECLDRSYSNSLSLKSIHVRAQVIDLVARVYLFQVYKNSSEKNLEVKYIFPLDSGAAICGFEAFIGNKHIVGEVKEKATARTEYETAKKEGHGAYLLEESSRNVFTIHVGNIPPLTTAVVKLTFISELIVEQDYVKFVLPNLGKLSRITNIKPEFSFEASLEMATEILSISSPTHKVIRKKTDTKAVIKLLPSVEDEPLTDLLLFIRIVNIHVPRMWIEKHPERDTRACMVTFYPEFNMQEGGSQESTRPLTFLLDASASMRGSDFQNLINITLMALELIKYNKPFNVVAFGTIYRDLFPTAQPFTMENHQKAKDFIADLCPNMGKATLSQLLRNYQLLTQSGDTTDIFLISNGVKDVEDNLLKMELNRLRIFSFGIGEANQHLLHLISRKTGGSYVNFKDVELKNWKIKIKNQVLKSNQPSLLDIHVEWQNEDDVLQAPKTIYSIFNSFSQIIYALNTFCTLATLKARIGKQEVSTVVFTHELSQTTGSMIHSLAAKAYIQDWEDGILDNDEILHTISKEDAKILVSSFAKEHSLVTSLTSFLAIEKRSTSDRDSVGEVDVEDLLKNIDIDILKYMEFSKLELNGSSTSTVNEKINENQIQYSQALRGKSRKNKMSKIVLDKARCTSSTVYNNGFYVSDGVAKQSADSVLLDCASFPPLPDKPPGSSPLIQNVVRPSFGSASQSSYGLPSFSPAPTSLCSTVPFPPVPFGSTQPLFGSVSQQSFGSAGCASASQPPAFSFRTAAKPSALFTPSSQAGASLFGSAPLQSPCSGTFQSPSSANQTQPCGNFLKSDPFVQLSEPAPPPATDFICDALFDDENLWASHIIQSRTPELTSLPGAQATRRNYFCNPAVPVPSFFAPEMNQMACNSAFKAAKLGVTRSMSTCNEQQSGASSIVPEKKSFTSDIGLKPTRRYLRRHSPNNEMEKSDPIVWSRHADLSLPVDKFSTPSIKESTIESIQNLSFYSAVEDNCLEFYSLCCEEESSPDCSSVSRCSNAEINLDVITNGNYPNTLCENVLRQLSWVKDAPLVWNYVIAKQNESSDQLEKAIQFMESYLMSKGGSFPMLNSLVNYVKDEMVKQGHNQKEIKEDLNSELNAMKDKARIQGQLIDDEKMNCSNKNCLCISIISMESDLLNNGLKSLGLKISEEVMEMVRYVAVIQTVLIAILEMLNDANPEILMDEPSSFEHILKRISYILLLEDNDTCIVEEFGILCHNYVHQFDKSYPLLYATLTRNKSWESFVFTHIKKNLLSC